MTQGIIRTYNVTSAGLATFGTNDFGAKVLSVIIKTGGSAANVDLRDQGAHAGPLRARLYVPATSSATFPMFGAKFVNQIWVDTDQTVDITFIGEAEG